MTSSLIPDSGFNSDLSIYHPITYFAQHTHTNKRSRLLKSKSQLHKYITDIIIQHTWNKHSKRLCNERHNIIDITDGKVSDSQFEFDPLSLHVHRHTNWKHAHKMRRSPLYWKHKLSHDRSVPIPVKNHGHHVWFYFEKTIHNQRHTFLVISLIAINRFPV